MDSQQILVQHTQVFQVLDGAFAKLGVGEFLLALGLSNMHVDTHTVLVSQFLGLDDQIVGIVKDGTQTEPDLYAAIAGVVETLQVSNLLIQLLLGGLLPDSGQTLAAVHNGLGQLTAQTRLGGSSCHAGDELTAGLSERGNTGADQLQAGHQSGDIGIFLGHVGLIGPHSLVQPGHKVHVITHTAGDLLGSMDMGIDKAGQYILALQVNDLCVGLYHLGVNLTHSNDVFTLDQHAAAVVDGFVSAHGHNVTVFQIGLHLQFLLKYIEKSLIKLG